MEKTLKYYNNRPVFVIEKDENTDFYKVLVRIEIEGKNLDEIAEQFRGCDACMVGHKSTCYCDERVNSANELLEVIFTENNIDEENIFYVRGKELKNEPFEWKENESLKEKIKGAKNILNGLIDIVAENKSLIKQQEKTLSDNESKIRQSESVVENRNSLKVHAINEYDKLKEDIKSLESQKKLIIVGSEVKIDYSEYENLLKRNQKLTALENGGVDNWEWYSESLKNYFENEND